MWHWTYKKLSLESVTKFRCPKFPHSVSIPFFVNLPLGHLRSKFKSCCRLTIFLHIQLIDVFLWFPVVSYICYFIICPQFCQLIYLNYSSLFILKNNLPSSKYLTFWRSLVQVTLDLCCISNCSRGSRVNFFISPLDPISNTTISSKVHTLKLHYVHILLSKKQTLKKLRF